MTYALFCIYNLFCFIYLLSLKYTIIKSIGYVIIIYTILLTIAHIDKRILNKKIYNFIMKKLK